MDAKTRRMLVVVVAVLALVAGGSAAFAVSQRSNSPSAQRQAFIKDVAGRLGVKQSALQNAFRQAAFDRIDAAVKAGMLTQKQANAIKARIRSGQFGPGGFGGPRAGMHGHFEAVLDAAASYIGITRQQLLDQLRSGKSAAEVATAHGKTVAGLKTAVLDAAQKQLDKAVADGNLTRTQADDMLNRLKSNIDNLLNRTGLPGPPDGGPGGWHDGNGPPTGMMGPPPGADGSGAPSFNGPPAGFGAPA